MTVCGTWTRRRPCSTAYPSRACSTDAPTSSGTSLARFEESAADLRRARELFSGSGDQVWEARVLNLQALVDVKLGEVESAAEAFARFGEISASLGDLSGVAVADHNTGWLAFLRGDLPRALEQYAAAAAFFDSRGTTNVDLVLDQVAAYLSGGLAQDALAVVESALVARPLQPREEADLLVAVAGAALAADDWDRAVSAADEGSSLLRAQSRHVHRLEADLLSITARDRAGEPPAPLLRRAERVVAGMREARAPQLPQALLVGAGLASRVRSARAAGLASDWLAEAASYRRATTGSERALGWLAQARARELAGDSGGVLRACELGLRALDEHRATLGSQELRAGSAGHGAALAELGTRTAMAGGDARQLLRWSERWRATALSTPARQRTPRREDHCRPGGPPGPAPTPGRRPLRRSAHGARSRRVPPGSSRRCAAACCRSEDPVRLPRPSTSGRSSRRSPRTTRSSSSWPSSTASCTRWWRVVAAYATGWSARQRLLPLPWTSRCSPCARPLAGAGPSSRWPAPGSSARCSGARWTAWGSRASWSRAPAALQGVPWGLLPSLAHRPVTGTPSARLWLRARGVGPADDRRVMLVGPGLGSGGAEVPAVAAEDPRREVLDGEAATVSAALAALDGVALAHVAAHGRFREDSPLFSSLTLADGPLLVHDLQRLRRPPHRVVLSACESGVMQPVGDQELLGLAAALLSMGTAGVVSSLAEVDDAATVDVMVALHARLRQGGGLGDAMLAAREAAAGVTRHTRAC